ncbi:MAG: hypothetical protein RMM98_01145 [Acidobacteriota bacterium]|nr:hypothetical protein [Blastocatellia bacterium]MDW8238192.1 hypothetical protein [Acidobacteriota bacterium]
MRYGVLLPLALVFGMSAFAQEAKENQLSETQARVEPGVKIRLALQTPISTRLNEVGDPVRAVLYDDLLINGRLVLARGTEFLGNITHVKPAGRPLKRAELALTFNRVKTSYGLEEVSTVITAVDDQVGDRKLKGDSEGVVRGGRGGGNTVENIYKGATIGSAGGLAVILLGKGSGGAATAAGTTILGAMAAGVLLTKAEDIRLARGTILRVQFDRSISLPFLSPHVDKQFDPEPDRDPDQDFDREPARF